MKVLFAGPSLHGFDPACARLGDLSSIDWRPPAAQGDIALAVTEGATTIGLVDGRFEDIAAVWHKEILYALGEGVQIFGAASMGALRAAECAPFGMIGIGTVFDRYHSGELEDDAAVAQLHAPAELGSTPITEALVNVEATLARFRALRAVTPDEADRMEASARAIFFKERTYSRILDHAGLSGGERGAQLKELIRRCRVDVKREDALVLLGYLAFIDTRRGERPAQWTLNSTYTMQLTLDRARRFAATATPIAA